MEEGRNALNILTGVLTGRKPLGRPRRRGEEDIKIDLEKIYTRNWVDSAQDRDYRSPCECGINLRFHKQWS